MVLSEAIHSPLGDWIQNLADELGPDHPYAKAVLALTDGTYAKPAKDDAQATEVHKKLRQAVDKYLAWNQAPILFENNSFKSRESFDEKLNELKELLRPLYELADLVLDAQIPGINSHDLLRHIEGVLYLIEQLWELSLQVAENRSLSPFQPLELYTALVAGVIHDAMLGLGGREDHEEKAALMTPLWISVKKGVTELNGFVANVAVLVGAHVTSSFDYDLNKTRGEHSRSYALLVLADEFQINQARVTERGRELYEAGVFDPWTYMNYMTDGVSFDWSEESQCPIITFKTNLGSQVLAEEFERNDLVRPEDGGEIGDIMQDRFLECLTKLLLDPKKISLFKSCFKALFGAPCFEIQVLNQKDRNIFSRAWYIS